ncbi:MAG TPA: tyrosine-type recombinase/integrase [Bryobacteraceae bacterium]|nr:tyrosine-type recombinase/integrase [Bryobacteraceae bacterium]
MRKQHPKKKRRTTPKAVLRLPDLDQAKSAILNSLTSVDAQRGYRHAIDEFVEWYCSEPRLSFNRTVVLRYRMHLESRKLAPGTINLRLGAVRRLAYEASDSGLLSADLAAGIRRVKGVKKIGVRLGTWLLPDQALALLGAPDAETMKGKRDLALLAILLACGLRRQEAVELNVSDLPQREEHWAIVDLIGKASHVRTVPVPDWVKDLIDDWLQTAGISTGRIFRRVTRAGTVWGNGLSEKVVWHVVRQYARKVGIEKLAPHDLRRYTESRTMPNRSCRCCFGVEFAVNVVKGFGIVRTVRGSSGKPIGHRQVDSGPVWF